MAFRGLSLANGSTLHQHQKGKLLTERQRGPITQAADAFLISTDRHCLGDYWAST